MSEFCALCGRSIAPGETLAEQVRAWVQGPDEELQEESAEPTGLAAHVRCLEALAALDREMDK